MRASNIAKQFVNVKYENDSKDKAEGPSIDKFEKDIDEQAVINMLVVEAEEQVMLKVTVAEVQRSLLKQMGVNLGGVINAGNFTTTLSDRKRSAADGCRWPRYAADSRYRHRPLRLEQHDHLQAAAIPACSATGTTVPADKTFGNSGLAAAGRAGNNRSRMPSVRSNVTA